MAGAVTLAVEPAGVVRTHPFMTLGLVATFALGGVAADATWNPRPWRAWSAATLLSAVGLFFLAKVIDTIISGQSHVSALGVPRILRMVMFVSLDVLSCRPVRARGEHPVGQPVPSP